MSEPNIPTPAPVTAPDELQGELEQLRSQLAERESAEKSALAEAIQKRIGAIPEALRGLLPEYDDPIKLFLWLDRNADLLKPRTAPDLNAGNAPAAHGGKPAASGDPVPGSADHLNEIRKRFRLGGRKW